VAVDLQKFSIGGYPMNKKWTIGALMISLAILIILTGCYSAREAKSSQAGKMQVYTSLFPLEDFARKIGGHHVQVTNMIPPGVEAHDFELSPQDMIRLSKADIFIYNGTGFETWADKVSQVLERNQVSVVNTTEKLQLLRTEAGDGQGEFDPHVWLDPLMAKQQALQIRDIFMEKDPENKADYEQNCARLILQLDQLDQAYQGMVRKAKKKEFITSHAAFAYLAHRYGLKQIAISGLSPADEPSAKELEKIIQTVERHQTKYILFETLVSGRVAEVVKKEVKAEALILNPLEGLTKEEVAQGADYFSVMRKNKENLAQALEVVSS
jgi:zinc transport system substrate-binding protein